MLPDTWHKDCVDTKCGASICSQECDECRTCPEGYFDVDVGSPARCMCIRGYRRSARDTMAPGDPCPWNNINASWDDCQAGAACMGNDNMGYCTGGYDSECTGIPESYNPDCVNCVCGFSFCSQECDAQGNCETGFYPVDFSGTCYCIPDQGGTRHLGEPCRFGNINNSHEFCHAGLTCFGDGNTGSCPGGSVDECTEIPQSHHPDCVNGTCGYSFCTYACDALGNCPQGFDPTDFGNACYCIPAY
jgi:hypothetical protein